MWIYLEHYGLAWNIVDAYSIGTHVAQDNKWKITIKFKNIDGKEDEDHIYIPQDRQIMKDICTNLLNQFKEVGAAQVTSQLEEAIRNA